MNYGKPAVDLPDLVRKLQTRGLVIGNPQSAVQTLEHVGYYRLTAYAYPFQRVLDPGKPFRAGTTFEEIVDLYNFDRRLRLLAMDAIERIEVAARACITTEMSLAHGPHWYLDPVHFDQNVLIPGTNRPLFNHSQFLAKLRRDLGVNRHPRQPHSEAFIEHYLVTYTNPLLPPSWMISETLTLGTISRIFAVLADRSKKRQIARRLSSGWQQIESWLHALTYIRNVCAHHGRLWNRSLSTPPALGNRMPPIPNRVRFYSVATVIWELLQIVDSSSRWNEHLADLIDSYPGTDLRAMGFPTNWRAEPFWKLPVLLPPT